MNRKFEYVIRIIINFIRFFLLKLVHWKKIKYSKKLLVSPKADICIINKGTIEFGNMCNLEKNTQIRSNGGNVFIGNNVYVNRNCNIVSHKSIVIENNVTIGPNVCIYDHDHNYKSDKNEKQYISNEIVIGHDTWIGASCIITKGVKIGSNSVIAAGTIVTKDVPSNVVLRSNCEYVVKKIED